MIDVEDGIIFRPETVRAAEIRKDANYASVRVTLLGLIDDFARDTQKQTQWQAFLGKNMLEALDLTVLVAALRDFLLPPISAANADSHFPQLWPTGGPWTSAAT